MSLPMLRACMGRVLQDKASMDLLRQAAATVGLRMDLCTMELPPAPPGEPSKP